jgi:hypothetical protein
MERASVKSAEQFILNTPTTPFAALMSAGRKKTAGAIERLRGHFQTKSHAPALSAGKDSMAARDIIHTSAAGQQIVGSK